MLKLTSLKLAQEVHLNKIKAHTPAREPKKKSLIYWRGSLFWFLLFCYWVIVLCSMSNTIIALTTFVSNACGPILPLFFVSLACHQGTRTISSKSGQKKAPDWRNVCDLRKDQPSAYLLYHLYCATNFWKLATPTTRAGTPSVRALSSKGGE